MTDAFQRLAWLVLAAAIAFAAASPVHAQTIPEGQSCGGLFCDLGIIGHKTEPAAPAAPAPVAAPPTTAAVPQTAAAPGPDVHRRLAKAPMARRRVAKVRQAPKALPVARAQSAAPAAQLAARPAAPAEPLLAAPIAAAPPPAVPARAPVRTNQHPLIFQSIDPMLQ